MFPSTTPPPPLSLSRRSAFVACAALVTLAAGCSTVRPRTSDRVDPNAGTVITSAVIQESGARTMWEALRRTVRFTVFTESGFGEPERIRRRGASTVVLREDMKIYLDGLEIHDVRILDEYPAVEIERIQVLTGIHATTYFGTGATDGVIVIATRTARR